MCDVFVCMCVRTHTLVHACVYNYVCKSVDVSIRACVLGVCICICK